MGEISELILEVACPFLAVKEVVAEAPDHDQHGERPVTWIVVAALENRPDNSGVARHADSRQAVFRRVNGPQMLFGCGRRCPLAGQDERRQAEIADDLLDQLVLLSRGVDDGFDGDNAALTRRVTFKSPETQLSRLHRLQQG